MKALKFRIAFYKACVTFQAELSMNKLGFLHHTPVEVKSVDGAQVMLSVQFSSHFIDPALMASHGLSWRTPRNLNPNYYKLEDASVWAVYL